MSRRNGAHADFLAGLGIDAEDIDIVRRLDAAAHGLFGMDRLGLAEAAVGFFFIDDAGGREDWDGIKLAGASRRSGDDGQAGAVGGGHHLQSKEGIAGFFGFE